MERDYWQMDLNAVEDAITPKTKAIVPVHIYGHPTDMDPLMEMADKHGIYVFEDAAEAHGGEYKGRRVGSLGDGAGFSFYGNKIITTGEGGMLTTNNRDVARLAWNLRDHAFSTDRHFWHKFIGFNYRMTNLQAAVGLAQVEQLDTFVAARRQNAAEYNCRLYGIPGITTPKEAEWAKNVYWMYGILVDEQEYGMSRDELRKVLADNGIETRTFFIPMHCQPVYWKTFYGQRYPVAEGLCRNGFYLPSASSLTISEIEYVTDVIRAACPNLGSAAQGANGYLWDEAVAKE
jgi:perosamine synthetase